MSNTRREIKGRFCLAAIHTGHAEERRMLKSNDFDNEFSSVNVQQNGLLYII